MVPNFVMIGQIVPKVWRFNCFLDGGHLLSWMFKNSKFNGQQG